MNNSIREFVTANLENVDRDKVLVRSLMNMVLGKYNNYQEGDYRYG